MLIFYLQFPDLSIKLIIPMSQFPLPISSTPLLKLIHTTIIFLNHLNNLFQFLNSFFFRFKQFNIIQFHRIWSIHLMYSTYIMSSFKILGSWFCYYFYSSITNSRIWLWWVLTTSSLICCWLGLFYLVTCWDVMMFWWSTYIKWLLSFTLSLSL